MNKYKTMSRKATIGFLAEYHRNPCLWKTSHEDFHSNNAKNVALNKLVDFSRQHWSKTTRADVIHKLKQLEAVFVKEHKRVQATGALPNLWYYDLMLFTVTDQHPKAKENIIRNQDKATQTVIDPGDGDNYFFLDDLETHPSEWNEKINEVVRRIYDDLREAAYSTDEEKLQLIETFNMSDYFDTKEFKPETPDSLPDDFLPESPKGSELKESEKNLPKLKLRKRKGKLINYYQEKI